jgi:hypothetical protein
MTYEDRLNRPKYQDLRKILTDNINPDYADYVVTRHTEPELDEMIAQYKDNPDYFIARHKGASDNDSYYDSEYKRRKDLAKEIKKDKFNKKKTVLVIKAFMNSNRMTMAQKLRKRADMSGVSDKELEQTDKLLPYFGKIRSHEDIKQIGDDIKSKDPYVGLSVFGITPKTKHADAYRHLAPLLGANSMATFVETTPDDIDEYSNKTQLEDLDPYSAEDAGTHSFAPIGYDAREIVERDLFRDNDEEFHINKGNIKSRITELDEQKGYTDTVNAVYNFLIKHGMPADSDEEMNPYINNALIKRYLHTQYGLSPYAINFIFKEDMRYPLEDRIRMALKTDQTRPVIDRMLNHPDNYGSDRRIKQITTALSGVI